MIIKMRKRAIGIVILAAAAVFIIVGLAQGDFLDTLHKAVMICLECIGIA